MSHIETENVLRFLRSKEIQLSSNNKWLLDCINWYKTHSELRNLYGSLQEYVCIQWLLSDLRDVQQSCLPVSCKDGTTQLTGKYCVQVNWVRDISQPCYTQLQAFQNVNIADSNDNVTAEETKKQNWEPNPKRVLMMEITDGLTTLKAMEYSLISKLTEPFIPGFKVILIGPIECRKGIMFLKENNINLLGGEVDYLNEINSKECLLSRCLNITPVQNARPERDTTPSVTSSYPQSISSRSDRSQQLYNDIDQLPDSTSFIESDLIVEAREVVMDDDDDEVFCQLPDTMFNDTNTLHSPPNQSSPVLNEDRIERDIQPSASAHAATKSPPAFNNESRKIKKPKLFPSMENLVPVGQESLNQSNIKRPTTSSPSKTIPVKMYSSEIPSTSSLFSTTNLDTSTIYKSKTSNDIQNASFESISSLNNTIVEQRAAGSESRGKIGQHYQNSSLDYNNDVVENLNVHINKNVYPQFKRVNVKVESITKLKIRNGEWNCSASVSMEDQIENVTFCNKVLEKLFGISAAEVEVWRGEMATNQSLKKKVNDILKSGQTKLKLLNCLMTVEYSSEESTPNIVCLNEV